MAFSDGLTGSWASKAAEAALLLFVFALIFMKDSIAVGGLRAIGSDLLFSLAAALSLVAVVKRQLTFRWHPFF